MSLRRQFGRAALFTTLSLAAVACFPEPPLRDAGDSAFVREVVPALIGRQPRNAAEVRLFNDIITGIASPADGRRGFMRGLMQSPEFKERWSEFLLRYGDVDRTTSALAACYGTATRAPSPTLNNKLAITSSQVNPGENGFNGLDVLNAMFKHPESDLSPFLRVNMFTSQAARMPGESQDAVASRIHQTFLDRQFDCMGCHNSKWATTASGSGWKRHYPMLGNFEMSLYGFHDGPDTLTKVTNVFRTNQAAGPVSCTGPACADGEQPWGSLSRACGDFVAKASIPAAPSAVSFGSLTTTNASVWDVEAMLKGGVDNMRNDWLRRTAGPGDQLCTNCPIGQFQAIASETCMSCHNPERAPSLGVFHFVLGNTAEQLGVQSGSGAVTPIRDFIGAINFMVQGDFMPPTDIPSADRDHIKAVVAALNAEGSTPGCSCSSGTWNRQVTPTDAFAFLTAANVVNGTWKELFGRPLTVQNHFPRTGSQSAALEWLAQRMVHDNWSLRAFLERVYLGKYYNRLAPTNWTAGLEVVEHFEVPPVLDPWTQTDRRVERNPDATGFNNAMSEGIRRRPVRTLLKAASAALGWPAPITFPTGTTLDMHRTLGDDLSATTPGAVDADMQNMLAWESLAGTCKNPAAPSDWISRLVTQGVAQGATREEALIALKDRLISEPWLDDVNERAALTTAMGTLSSPLTTADGDNLRGVCGVLLHSPQFMLQGLVPNGAHATATPSLKVCLDGEPCSYKQLCDAWALHFENAGYLLTCPVSEELAFKFPAELRPRLRMKIEQLPSLCTNGVCGFIRQGQSERDKACQKDPTQCLPTELMSCDTRCSGMFCCGESLKDIDDTFAKGEKGMLYTVADGSKVYQAENIVLLTKGGGTEKLQKGMPLKAGNILRVYRGAILMAEGPYGKISTPEKGIDFGVKQEYVDVLIGRINQLDEKEAARDEEEYYGAMVPSQDHQGTFLSRVHSTRWTPHLNSVSPSYEKNPKEGERLRQIDLKYEAERMKEEDALYQKWLKEKGEDEEEEKDEKDQVIIKKPIVIDPGKLRPVIVAPKPKLP